MLECEVVMVSVGVDADQWYGGIAPVAGSGGGSLIQLLQFHWEPSSNWGLRALGVTRI